MILLSLLFSVKAVALLYTPFICFGLPFLASMLIIIAIFFLSVKKKGKRMDRRGLGEERLGFRFYGWV